MIPAHANKAQLRIGDEDVYVFRSSIGFADLKVEVMKAGVLSGQGHFNVDTLNAILAGGNDKVRLVSVDGESVKERPRTRKKSSGAKKSGSANARKGSSSKSPATKKAPAKKSSGSSKKKSTSGGASAS